MVFLAGPGVKNRTWWWLDMLAKKTILVATGSVDTLSGRLKRLTEEAYDGPEAGNID
jgi:hypothetical protein